jgi:integrase
MMARKPKLWSVTVGGHYHTVTVCERRAGGNLHLRWWEADAKKGHHRWKSLGHNDRKHGEEQARELSGELLNATRATRSPRVTVLELLARYEEEVTAHRKPELAAEDRRRIETWQHFMGDREARAIDFPALDRFVRERRAGSIKVPGHKLSKKPSDTTIGADLIFLNTVLNWAGRVMLPNGSRLLSENPIRGYDRPKNRNPKQPVATYDRFLAVRAKAESADPQRLFAYFLDLIEGLGWRVSAVCQLQASDIDRRTDEDAPFGRIRKRAENDKENVDAWIPLSKDTRAAVDGILERNPTIGDLPLFPAPKTRKGDRPGPWTRFHARNLLRRAEKAAELDALAGGDFHPYRRKWSTERKDLPAQDVALAGGWRDLRSLERSYQKADAQTVLRVMTEPRKLREAKKGA